MCFNTVSVLFLVKVYPFILHSDETEITFASPRDVDEGVFYVDDDEVIDISNINDEKVIILFACVYL